MAERASRVRQTETVVLRALTEHNGKLNVGQVIVAGLRRPLTINEALNNLKRKQQIQKDKYGGIIWKIRD